MNEWMNERTNQSTEPWKRNQGRKKEGRKKGGRALVGKTDREDKQRWPEWRLDDGAESLVIIALLIYALWKSTISLPLSMAAGLSAIFRRSREKGASFTKSFWFTLLSHEDFSPILHKKFTMLESLNKWTNDWPSKTANCGLDLERSERKGGPLLCSLNDFPSRAWARIVVLPPARRNIRPASHPRENRKFLWRYPWTRDDPRFRSDVRFIEKCREFDSAFSKNPFTAVQLGNKIWRKWRDGTKLRVLSLKHPNHAVSSAASNIVSRVEKPFRTCFQRLISVRVELLSETSVYCARLQKHPWSCFAWLESRLQRLGKVCLLLINSTHQSPKVL